MDWVFENNMILGHDIYLHGKSFGTAVATFAATELSSKEGHPAREIFKGLILECGFTSVQNIVTAKAGAFVAKNLFPDVKWATEERI